MANGVLTSVGRLGLPADRSVSTLAWSPDGSAIAASTSRDGEVDEHLEWLLEIPWFERFAYPKYESQVQVWDVSTGNLRQTLTGGAPRHGVIHPVAWSPDGMSVAAASTEGQVTIWDATTGRRVRQLKGHRNGVTALAWRSHRIVSACHDRTIRVWDDTSGRCLRVLRGHEARVGDLAIASDGRRLASAGHDSTVRIWDHFLGVQHDVLRAHAKVMQLAWSPDAATIACVCWQPSSIRLVELETGASRVLANLEDPSDVAFSNDGRWLATCASGRVQLWSTRTWLPSGDEIPGSRVRFQPTGEALAVLDRKANEIHLWNLASASVDPVSTPMTGTVFVSHASVDARQVARLILEPLKRAGIPLWYSESDIRTAEEWERSIQAGLESCRWLLVVLSRNSVCSQWVRTEVSWAMRNRPGRVLPVLIEDCNPDDLHLRLASIQCLDLRAEAERKVADLVALLSKAATPDS